MVNLIYPFTSSGQKIMLICFDFDGILANSALLKFNLFKEAGLKFLPPQYQNQFFAFLKDNPNQSRIEKLSYISTRSEINIDDLLFWFKKSLLSKKIDLFKPDFNFIKNLKLHHSAIISAAPLEDLLYISSKEFLQIFSSEGVFASCKDKANTLSELKAKLQKNTKKFIFIGDTPADMKSARKAKFDFIPLSKWSCYDWSFEIYPYQLDSLNNLFETPICENDF